MAALGAWLTAIALYRFCSWPYWLSQVAGFAAGTAINYPISRQWAFQSHYPHIPRQLLIFLGITSIGLGINEGTLWCVVTLFHFWVILGMALGLGTAFIWNFTMNRWLTFGLTDAS